MFQANANQTGAAFFAHNIRSPYDAYYSYSNPNNTTHQSHQVRIFNFKGNRAFGESGMETYSAWETANGRPVPPSYPFGTYILPNVYSVEEWQKRGHGVVTAFAFINGVFQYAANRYGLGSESIPRSRKLLVARRRGLGWFANIFLAGNVWVWYVARCKKNSDAGLHYHITNRERLTASVLMGLANGSVAPKSGAPWFGQYPRGSIMWHWVKFFVVWYAFFYGCCMDQWMYRSMARLVNWKYEPAIYNVNPWWLDEKETSRPYQIFEATQKVRTMTVKQCKEEVKYEPVELVDEYSPEYEYKRRYKYAL